MKPGYIVDHLSAHESQGLVSLTYWNSNWQPPVEYGHTVAIFKLKPKQNANLHIPNTADSREN